ncbi:hypothetical protein K1T71_002767 [Dendrolimus kikuchii]|uniref:Uncharacterized protein n=1 Tax=Dendrolimus kikuchii TaxID=765133 RepID=A0ACC1DDZ2_9NEOP|nr:hypothetical protein K1T71_002767 [Dendrolimus kikuchii]
MTQIQRYVNRITSYKRRRAGVPRTQRSSPRASIPVARVDLYHQFANHFKGLRISQSAMPTPEYSVELQQGEPPPEILEYARQHCGEDPNTRLQAICELRELIYERGECTPHRMDDEFLIRFLRARNFIPQRAHRLMANYYQFKEDYPELFDVYPMDLHAIGDANVITVPPYKDQDGRRLLLWRVGCWDPKTISVEELFKATVLSLELGVLEPQNQILGGVALFDLEDLSTQHAWQVTPSVASKIVKLLVSCFPANTHAIHVINHSWIFDKIYNIFRPFLNSVMRSRIFFHGYDVTSLHKHIHPDHLPKRYGGIWPDYSYTIWLESLKKNKEVAKEMIKCGYKFRDYEVSPEVLRQLKDEGIKLF